MSAITTHVLDTSLGRPASGVAVRLERREGAAWIELGRGAHRRRRPLPEPAARGRPRSQPAVYRLTLRHRGLLRRARRRRRFYPEVGVVFEVREPAQHYHVPLLLSPFGYSTYRGS